MSTKVKSVVRRLGQGYLGHVVADARSHAAPRRFDPVAEVTAAFVGPGQADTPASAVPDLAAQPPRHRQPRPASILPQPLVGHESQADESGPPEAAEPVVRKIKAFHRRNRSAAGAPDVSSDRPTIRPKSEPSESTHGPRAGGGAGIGKSAAMRERTTTYKIAKKDGGLKVKTVPSPPTGPKFSQPTDRTAPSGGGKSLEAPGGAAGGQQSERLQAGPDPEAPSDGRGRTGRDGRQRPIGAGSRSESGVDPLSAKPNEDLRLAPRAPQPVPRSRKDAQPASAGLTAAQPPAERPTSAQAETKPKNPAAPRGAVGPSRRREVRQSVAGQDRGPRVQIGSVDVQVVMDSPEPATEKVASRPQPYIGSSRASRLYQRRL